jgi:hypothetical protein
MHVSEYRGSHRVSPIEHCRGIVQWNGGLYVGMFNSVRRYAVTNPHTLELQPEEMLSHPRAVDLHGIHAGGDRLLAASTGTDAVLEWSSRAASPFVYSLSPSDERDLRFPAGLARDAGCSDWREVLPTSRHINDVCSLERGTIVVSSLHQILELGDGRARVLYEDRAALLHDGRPLSDGRLLFSDGAKGMLLIIDRDGTPPVRIEVARHDRWFVRGLSVVDGHAIVLRSLLGRSRQRSLDPGRNEDAPEIGSRFGISVVDLETRSVLDEATIETSRLCSGVNAYSVISWEQEVPSGASSTVGA